MALRHYRVEENRTACGKSINFRSMQTTIVWEKTTCEWCWDMIMGISDGSKDQESSS